MQESIKRQVKQYWDNEPCGTRGNSYPKGTREYYDAISINRYKIETWIPKFAEFEKWKGKRVLEVGCGVGTDLVEFSKHGAVVTGIDLSSKSVVLAQKQLTLCKLDGDTFECDAESIPFKDGTFDMIYSWGVLHHTPNPEQVVSEIHRILKKNAEVRVMLYHKPSLVCLQMWIRFGLFAGKPFRSIDEIMYHNHESLGTKACTVGQARELLSVFRELNICTVPTSYDIRYARDKYLPMWCMNLVPKRLGWYILIRGKK